MRNILIGKGRRALRKIPVIDLSECTDCGSCMDLCPAVFRKNTETGLIEVIDLLEYPEDELMEAISMCPADCITLEEGE